MSCLSEQSSDIIKTINSTMGQTIAYPSGYTKDSFLPLTVLIKLSDGENYFYSPTNFELQMLDVGVRILALGQSISGRDCILAYTKK